MRIAELEQKSGFGRDTIRYYERMGLLSAVRRDENGYRRYEPHALVELAFVAKAQAVGFTLKQIQPAIAKLRAPPRQCQELIASLKAKGAEIEQRIAQDQQRLVHLQRMLERLQRPDKGAP